ncbi:YniB family protein [Paraburkholderia pallida]|uniref:Uncharacterized protein n=1 Tax=Paraburkholderia pallida TaxID=2547399 RepID=A0A4P7CRL7_9BURK|nr:YniB family protein [Paraburkholderia pallida]QBQ96911.1 hypothetical protein E1956_06770 [Paraburkholderia pallida]
MRYREEKDKVFGYRVVGLIMVAGGGVFTLASILKFFYFGLDSGDPLSHALAQPFKNLVSLAYGLTSPYLNIVWRVAALPNFREYVSWGNGGFIFEYLVLIFGIGRIRAAGRLTGRIAEARKILEDEQLRQSVRPGGGEPPAQTQSTTPVQMQSTTPVPSGNGGGFKLFHALYIGPVVAAVVAQIIEKIFHLT